MTTKYPCYLEFSDTGHFARLVHKSEFVIAEFLISDTNLSNRAAAAHDRLGFSKLDPKFREVKQVYRGEIHEIMNPEIIKEEITELEMTYNEMIEMKEMMLNQLEGNEAK